MNPNERIKEFVESSFLAPLLKKEGVTDISFNGVDLFYEDNHHGRKKANVHVDSSKVGDFLRQIANLAEKQFSYLNSVLDVSFSHYRLNAVFLSIGRVYDQKVYTFSLRICHEGSAISQDPSFFKGKSKKILLDALARRESIVIAGETGSGKTELQKYLLLHLPPATRVIVIDNVEELELSRGDGDLDLTSWRVDERFPDSSFPFLIRNALRNNPDYLLVAEARGEEMLSALNAVMSGHPLITTLHAKDIEAIPHRMARMAQGNEGKLSYDDLLSDVYHHFSTVVYLRKVTEEGEVKRFVSQIGVLNEKEMKVDIVFSVEASS